MSFRALTPSTDGKKVFVDGVQSRGELVRYDSNTRRFVPYLSGISAEAVSFSKDGDWVAYVAYPEGTLWRSKVNGSQRLQIGFPPMRAFQLRWSPDAKQIAFMATMPGRPWQIYVVSVDGGAPRQLTTNERNYGDPDWSPDGGSLVFGALPFIESDRASAIYVLDVRANHPARVLPGSEGLYSPRWSPDGRYLAATTSDNSKIVGLDFTSKKWSDWAKITPNYYNWSRDAKYLYLDSRDGGDAAFYRLQISDRKLERLTSLQELGRLANGAYGTWTGLTPDDSPLALRDIGSQEIYSLDWEAP